MSFPDCWIVYLRDPKTASRCEAYVVATPQERSHAEKRLGNACVSVRIDGITPQGIWYSEWLAGRDGAGFCLYVFGKEEVAKVEASRSWLRNTQDVVRLETLRCKRLTFKKD